MLKSLNYSALALSWVFLLFSAAHAEQNETPKILLIDSLICLELLPVEAASKIAKIESQSPANCKTDYLKDSRPFHGHQTLLSFLTHLKSQEKIHLIHLIPFNSKGEQDFEKFKGLHERLIAETFSIVIMPMAGLMPKLKELSVDQWRSPVFLASGQRGAGGVSEGQFFWPHGSLTAKNQTQFLVIGTYLPLNDDLVIENSELIHKDLIDLYLSENESFSDFTGSSRGTAEAAAKALNLCSKSQQSLMNCFKKHLKTISATSGKQLPTL